jgi:Pyridoxamine 5'-phosphate oxidase
MKSWQEFSLEDPQLAHVGLRLLFQTRPQFGYAFLATLRKDGAPRLHPVSVVFSNDHLYVLIPPGSPKCSDLIRDGRYALQAFPPAQNAQNEEFYLSGIALSIGDTSLRHAIIEDTKIIVDENEVMFELLFDRAMYTRLENPGTPDEHPVHRKWLITG